MPFLRSITVTLALSICCLSLINAQNDSLGTLRAWTLEHDGSVEEFVPDTSLDGSFQSYPFYFNEFLGYNGNTWSPVYPLFNDPRYINGNVTGNFLKFYPAIRNNQYFNTHKPFTLLYFNNNAKKPLPEQNLEFIHTQNITRWWNAGISGNFANSKGMYLHQENRINTFRIFTSYTSPKHTGYISYIFGKAGFQENGGITDISLYKDSLQDPENIPVNLTDAQNAIKYKALYIKQEHILSRANRDTIKACYPWTVSAGASFDFTRSRKIYTDKASNYYQNIFVDSASTYDSLQLSHYETSAYLKLGLCNKAWISSGVFLERNEYGVMDNHFRHDALGIFGHALYESGKFKAITGIHSHISENENSMFSLNSYLSYIVSEKYLTVYAEGNYSTNHPYLFDKYYISNNFFWKKDFLNISNTTINAGLIVPAYKARLSITSELLNNAIYYDSLALPAQLSDPLSCLSATLEFRLNAGHWLYKPVFLYQSISSDVIPGIPSFITVQHISYNNRIFKVLEIQGGAELFYTSSFFGPAYMPATMTYYSQKVQETGGYPVADIFISMKLKRARFLFKVHNVADRFIPRNNFIVAGYPLPDRHFTLGISWSFYN